MKIFIILTLIVIVANATTVVVEFYPTNNCTGIPTKQTFETDVCSEIESNPKGYTKYVKTEMISRFCRMCSDYREF
jgi:hypothetical protein